MTKIAVLGYGTVGSGVVEVLKMNQDLISKKAGEKIEVKYVFGRHEYKGTPAEKLVVHDFETILNDKEIEIIVEVMGGVDTAYTFVKRALLMDKHVVTANKALVAAYGCELLKTAQEHKVNFMFEASVAGTIPIIRSLNCALTADKINKITGILNGTTNYMMTDMFYHGADYKESLKEAQDKGYAESNPEADVEGYDACRKLAILASVISGKYVDFQKIYTEGITKISKIDMKYADQMGMTIKLLASAVEEGDQIQAIVAPFLLKQDHPLYSVNGVFNAVFVKGNVSGDTMFYGSGAGKLPTAGAVISDVIEIVKNKEKNIMAFWTEEEQVLTEHRETKRRFFVRMSGNREDYEEKIKENFKEVQFLKLDHVTNEFAFVTEKIKEGVYEEKAGAFSNILHMIRIED